LSGLAGGDGEEICWSDRRLQLSLLLSPAAAGAAVEMGEVAGSVEAEELRLLWCLLELDRPREGKVPAAVLAGEKGGLCAGG